MSWTAATYAAYLLVALPLTIWVGSTLSRHGGVFLSDVFEGRAEVGHAVNRLLVVGFYLVNAGFVMLYLRLDSEVLELTGMVETLSVKIGVILLVLGVLHLGNVLVFSSFRRRARLDVLHGGGPRHPTTSTPTRGGQ